MRQRKSAAAGGGQVSVPSPVSTPRPTLQIDLTEDGASPSAGAASAASAAAAAGSRSAPAAAGVVLVGSSGPPSLSRTLRSATPTFGKNGDTNPFINRRISVPCWLWALWVFPGAVLVPARLLLLLASGLLAMAFAGVGTWRLRSPDAPHSLWRRVVLAPVRPLVRVFLWSLGVLWVDVRGRAAPRSIAPIIVSNHISFVEAVVLICVTECMPVADKALISSNPIYSAVVYALRGILVDRADKTAPAVAAAEGSRSSTAPSLLRPSGPAAAPTAAAAASIGGRRKVRGQDGADRPPALAPPSSSDAPPPPPFLSPRELIALRAGNDALPHVLIFPEGTTTNGTAVITFKNGAFAPGRPVQPVAVRYPDADVLVDPSWASEGPSLPWLLLRLLATPCTRVRVDFLPVYAPSVAEAADADAYARAVQLLIARALRVTPTRHSLEDVKLMALARTLAHYPVEFAAVEWEHFRAVLDLHSLWGNDTAKRYLRQFVEADARRTGRLDYAAFKGLVTHASSARAAGAGRPWGPHPLQDDAFLRRLFRLMDVDGVGSLDFREFLAGMAIVNDHGPAGGHGAIALAFRILDADGDGRLTRDNLAPVLRRIYPALDDAKVDEAYKEADRDGDGSISYADFLAWAQAHADKKELMRGALLGFETEEDLLASPPGEGEAEDQGGAGRRGDSSGSRGGGIGIGANGSVAARAAKTDTATTAAAMTTSKGGRSARKKSY